MKALSVLLIFLFSADYSVSAGMVCNWGDTVSIDHSCPGILDPADKSWCCVDTSGQPKCCTFIEFALTYIIIGLVILAIVSVVCSIVCCICCPCCFIYKRRHGNII